MQKKISFYCFNNCLFYVFWVQATQACWTFNLSTSVISSHQLQVRVMLNGALNYATKQINNLSMLAVVSKT